jgi:hypothetical protein
MTEGIARAWLVEEGAAVESVDELLQRRSSASR